MEHEPRSNDVADFLFLARRKGVRIWATNGQLHYQAPKDALSPDEYSTLLSQREKFIAFLQPRLPCSLVDGPPLARAATEIVPLTFSQEVMWNFHDKGRRPSHLAQLPVRLMGHWNSEFLQQSFAELVRRHEALRTRIVTINGVPRQEIDEAHGFRLRTILAPDIPQANREIFVRGFIAELAKESVDVSVGPLFAARLLTFEVSDQVLIVSWNHLFFDAISIQLLWRELWAMYVQRLLGQPCGLPKPQIQFADYAVWQRKTDVWWMGKHGTYWSERLAGANHVRLFAHDVISNTSHPKVRLVSTRIDGTTIENLVKLGRREMTTLGIVLLTAYVALVLRWCNTAEVTISFVTAGRLCPEVWNTIGNFSSSIFLRAYLSEEDSFIHLMKRVITEWKSAYKHDDSCRTFTQAPLPEFALSTSFNWFPREASMDPTAHFDASAFCQLGNALSLQALEIDWALDNAVAVVDKGYMVAVEPRLTLYEDKDGVRADMYFIDSLVSPNSVERFLGNFKYVTEALLKDPNSRVSSILSGT